MEFSRPEYWSRLPFPSPGGLPNPGIEPRSAALHADSLPAEPPGKPKNTAVGGRPFSRGSSRPRNQIGVFCIAGTFFTGWATREARFLKNVYLFIHLPPANLWRSIHQHPRIENKFLKEIVGPWSRKSFEKKVFWVQSQCFELSGSSDSFPEL